VPDGEDSAVLIGLRGHVLHGHVPHGHASHGALLEVAQNRHPPTKSFSLSSRLLAADTSRGGKTRKQVDFT